MPTGIYLITLIHHQPSTKLTEKYGLQKKPWSPHMSLKHTSVKIHVDSSVTAYRRTHGELKCLLSKTDFLPTNIFKRVTHSRFRPPVLLRNTTCRWFYRCYKPIHGRKSFLNRRIESNEFWLRISHCLMIRLEQTREKKPQWARIINTTTTDFVWWLPRSKLQVGIAF